MRREPGPALVWGGPVPSMAVVEPSSSEPLAYLVALDELDAILADLEESSVDVDQLAQRVKRASELIALCRERISAARLEVEEIVAESDGPLETL
jgi:exodeoxyribonuclease VII small subunit